MLRVLCMRTTFSLYTRQTAPYERMFLGFFWSPREKKSPFVALAVQQHLSKGVAAEQVRDVSVGCSEVQWSIASTVVV